MIDIIEEPKPDPEIVIEQNQLINGNVKFQIKGLKVYLFTL